MHNKFYKLFGNIGRQPKRRSFNDFDFIWFLRIFVDVYCTLSIAQLHFNVIFGWNLSSSSQKFKKFLMNSRLLRTLTPWIWFLSMQLPLDLIHWHTGCQLLVKQRLVFEPFSTVICSHSILQSFISSAYTFSVLLSRTFPSFVTYISVCNGISSNSTRFDEKRVGESRCCSEVPSKRTLICVWRQF